MPISTPPTFKGGYANIALGTAGFILTSHGPGSPPTFQAAAASGGVGPSVNFSPASGAVDPAIPGFTAGVGSAGTGRLKITLAGDTSFLGMPAGDDGQQLFGTIVGGAFTLTLDHLNGGTTQAQIYASNDFVFSLHDTFQLLYDSGLSAWLLIV